MMKTNYYVVINKFYDHFRLRNLMIKRDHNNCINNLNDHINLKWFLLFYINSKTLDVEIRDHGTWIRKNTIKTLSIKYVFIYIQHAYLIFWETIVPMLWKQFLIVLKFFDSYIFLNILPYLNIQIFNMFYMFLLHLLYFKVLLYRNVVVEEFKMAERLVKEISCKGLQFVCMRGQSGTLC